MIIAKLKNLFADSSRLILLLVLSLVFANASSLTVSAQDGFTLWDDNCSDCHSIGDGIYLGPDLQGINAKRPASWLISFIKSSKTMIANGDAEAVALFAEFRNKKMPDFALSDAEINAILAYIKSQSPQTNTNTTETTNPAPDEQNQNIDEANTDISTDNNSGQSTDNSSSNTNASNGISEERFNKLEEKIDHVIEFQQYLRPTEITNRDIKKGKRLFMGKTEFEFGLPACNTCHALEPVDSLFWNPSVTEIVRKYRRGSGLKYEDVLTDPQPEKMKALIKEHPLTKTEIFYLVAYLNDLSKQDYDPQLPRDKKSKAAIIVLILIFLSLIDLLFTKFVRPRIIPTMIFLLGFIFESYVVFGEATSVGLSKGYAPEQPIKFSHKVHAGENQIDCQYCHSTVEYSQTAGIPSASICMNCHNKIKEGSHSGSFELDKLRTSVKENQPIAWIKVDNLPDHVHFSHASHVNIGKIDCATCHGDVKEMDQIEQVNTLSMGWCLNCHRRHEVDFSNRFYDSYEVLHNKLDSGDIDTVVVKNIGGEDCQHCHY